MIFLHFTRFGELLQGHANAHEANNGFLIVRVAFDCFLQKDL